MYVHFSSLSDNAESLKLITFVAFLLWYLNTASQHCLGTTSASVQSSVSLVSRTHSRWSARAFMQHWRRLLLLTAQWRSEMLDPDVTERDDAQRQMSIFSDSVDLQFYPSYPEQTYNKS